MGNISLLRLDLLGGAAPGNKSFKLAEYIAQAQLGGAKRLLSFGGVWSNHLHALAAIGHEHGLETIGVVRGEAQEGETAMLAEARRWGMRIEHVSRSEYRQRDEPRYQEELSRRHGPCLIIPEGGAGISGARGCVQIAALISASFDAPRHIVLPVGTGTTTAGLAHALNTEFTVTGISALKGAHDLEQRVHQLLQELGEKPHAHWSILHDYHCGGFARASVELKSFQQEFERVHKVALDPVYTAKMMYAVHRQLEEGACDSDARLLAVHTGGLQGRRGYPWLG